MLNDDDGGGDGGDTGATGTTGAENTGTVNVLNAMEPAEAEAVQTAVDENIVDADYTVEIEASADFEEQFQIRAEGGTLDITLCRSPARSSSRPRPARSSSLEDLGFDIAELEATFGEYFLVARRVRRRALRDPDEHQPEEHGLVPEGRLRRGRLPGPDHVG